MRAFATPGARPPPRSIAATSSGRSLQARRCHKVVPPSMRAGQAALLLLVLGALPWPQAAAEQVRCGPAQRRKAPGVAPTGLASRAVLPPPALHTIEQCLPSLPPTPTHHQQPLSHALRSAPAAPALQQPLLPSILSTHCFPPRPALPRLSRRRSGRSAAAASSARPLTTPPFTTCC